jgi:hypothetical protein
MENSKLVRATFLARPNRFLAYVMVDDHFEKSCIKTARLFEDLFVPGKTVFLRYRKDHSSYDRYTPSDIVAVWHEGQIIYLDQDIPKRVTIPFLNAVCSVIITTISASTTKTGLQFLSMFSLFQWNMTATPFSLTGRRKNTVKKYVILLLLPRWARKLVLFSSL